MANWIDEQIHKLPKEVVDYVGNPQFNIKLQNILTPYDLDKEEVDAVKEEIYIFIVGGTDPEDFSTVIGIASLLDNEEVTKLANELFEKLLEPIMDLLMNFWLKDIEIEEMPESELNSISLSTASDPYLNSIPTSPLKTQATSSLSSSVRAPQKTKRVTDEDLLQAKKALSDPYRENI